MTINNDHVNCPWEKQGNVGHGASKETRYVLTSTKWSFYEFTWWEIVV